LGILYKLRDMSVIDSKIYLKIFQVSEFQSSSKCRDATQGILTGFLEDIFRSFDILYIGDIKELSFYREESKAG
jgi:hypothetical protein